MSGARHDVSVASPTLRNGLPRLVVFIMWDDPDGCDAASVGAMVAAIQEKKEKAKARVKSSRDRQGKLRARGEKWFRTS